MWDILSTPVTGSRETEFILYSGSSVLAQRENVEEKFKIVNIFNNETEMGGSVTFSLLLIIQSDEA